MNENAIPSHDFNFEQIHEYWRALEDYEAATEYLLHVKGQLEFAGGTIAMRFFTEAETQWHLAAWKEEAHPLPEGGTVDALAIKRKLRDVVYRQFGFHFLLRGVDELTEPFPASLDFDTRFFDVVSFVDDETGKRYLSIDLMVRWLRKCLGNQQKELDYLMHRGEMTRRDAMAPSKKRRRNATIVWLEDKNAIPFLFKKLRDFEIIDMDTDTWAALDGVFADEIDGVPISKEELAIKSTQLKKKKLAPGVPRRPDEIEEAVTETKKYSRKSRNST